METVVRVAPDRLVVEHLELSDPDLVRFVGERAEMERPELVERALRIGLLAVRDAGLTVNVDVIEKEFARLVQQIDDRNEKASQALAQALRESFAEDGGRLPRTLERFLGDQGALRRLVADLFDEGRRDSAIGRLNDLMGRYFDGDGSRLAQLLDPTRLGSPLYQFRSEVSKGFEDLAGRIQALEKASDVRASERARSAAKGIDFEDVLEEMLGDITRGLGDGLERTGTLAGETIKAKKGDFVLTVDPSRTRGADLRVVIESKDRVMSTRQVTEELAAARQNRSAQAAVIVFTPQHAPANVDPLAIVNRDVWCVVDPSAPDRLPLECAVRLARIFALDALRERPVEVDVAAVDRALEGIRAQLSAIQGMRSNLTSITNATTKVSADLDGLRVGILRSVTQIEEELKAAAASVPQRVPA
ncbi:MAG: hypothetical protein M0Z49_05290 [Chloroflexi bacterium]|nr:hypothetical protein [Chloroflexota bacterium]